ncbi:Eukaryotic translation initiation factor 5A [Heracleum sosnowskyi]|uniref:Eukaryotic translation initiation factor 5A n=1 Tax=Heracleum sosnowskyi TaxID=360622 RepID=A0AAD8I1D9_9APIA|nr:Eukaryotic translation initiation factor 5A [Heracleum sosnowskyi]
MPDGGHAFEPSSKTDAKASMYTVHQVEDVEDYVCVRNNIPCKIKLIMTVKNPKNKDGPRKRLFVAIDVFTGKVFKATFSLTGTCVVPRVTYTEYQLVDIFEDDSYVTLVDDKGNLELNVKLPTKEALRSLIKVGFAEGKDVFVSVVSAMGRAEIIASYVRDYVQDPK